MTGKTHVIVGTAAGLAAASALEPGLASPAALACAAAGGALGRHASRPRRQKSPRTRCRSGSRAAGAPRCSSLRWGWRRPPAGRLARRAAGAGLEVVVAGVIALLALCCAARLSTHRGFSHSLLALAGFAAATWLVCPPLAPCVAAGMASHLALDALGRRPVRLAWPVRRGVCLGLCKTDGVVEACCLVAGLAVAAYVVLM